MDKKKGSLSLANESNNKQRGTFKITYLHGNYKLSYKKKYNGVYIF